MSAARSASGLRRIAEPFVVAPPSRVRIRTRLHPTGTEARALAAIGGHLGQLYRTDLAGRVRLGKVPAALRGRTQRKRAMTALASSRWAGSITWAVEDQYQLGLRALAAEATGLRSAVEAIERRANVPAGTTAGSAATAGKVRGYRNGAERFQKTHRLARLRERLAAAEDALRAGTPSIAVGGGRLWKARNNLEAANLTVADWDRHWAAARWFLTADGESGKRWGNETIRVTGDGSVLGDNAGVVSVKVPAPLVPVLGSRLVLGTPVSFAHRGQEWQDRVGSNKCVRYDISYNPARGRWYLDASWHYADTPVPGVGALQGSRMVGVDLNAGHLAAAILDSHGNPVGTPATIPLDLDGASASTRDGRLRAAITALLDLARDAGITTVAVENLNFREARATGRETMGRGARGKRFRRTVHGMPTANFRDRLVAMAANRGLHILAVDPAHTSLWGGQHWQKPLQEASDSTVTGHHAAAVAIGRRAQGHRIRRREDGPRTRQRTRAGHPSPRPHPTPLGTAACTGPARTMATNHPSPPGTTRGQPPTTVRGARAKPKRTK